MTEREQSEANGVAARIISLTNTRYRERVLIARLAHLVMEDHGYNQNEIMEWIENDEHSLWSKE